MRLTPWYLAAVAPIAVAGFLGAFLGQCAVLAVTIGIFVGTLSLGRHAPQAAAPQTANTTELT
jgi:sorbitol-specific phosphotransferase system component IIBC